MLNKMPPRFLLPALCVLPLLAAACSSQSDGEAVKATEAQMFEHTKTYCFGRFLVDVPYDVVLQAQGHKYYSSSFESGRGGDEFKTKLSSMLEKRKKETFEHGSTFVRTEFPEENKQQIIVSKEDLFGDVGYTFDVFALKGFNYYFYFTVDAFTEEQTERAVKNYRDKILPALRHRAEHEIPKEAGFCFENGFIAEAGTPGWSEEASLAFTLKGHQDVWIRIESEVYFSPEKTLIERYKKGGSESWVREDSVRRREVNGMAGDELLLSGVKDGNTTHYYQWETLGETKNPLKPGILLEIQTGEPVEGIPGPSSLEKAQVRALYEGIVKSIRLRPVAGSKPEAQAPGSFPRRFATGDACPKAGLWRCVEDGKVLAFIEGQIMPRAAFDKPATGWLDRLRGIKKRYSHMGQGHWEWAGEASAADGKRG